MSDEAPSPPESIDTDVHAFREKVERALPGEPFMIDVAFRAVTLRRIDLERGNDETFCNWIRTAVDERFQLIEYRNIQRGDEPPRSRPPDDTPAYDTPDEEIVAEVSQVAPDKWVSVTVEFPAGVLVALLQVAGERGDVGEWIRSATRIRFSKIERKSVLQPTVRVDVPPKVAQRARLRAEYACCIHSGADYDNALLDALLQLVEPQTEYVVGGELIGSFGDRDDALKEEDQE